VRDVAWWLPFVVAIIAVAIMVTCILWPCVADLCMYALSCIGLAAAVHVAPDKNLSVLNLVLGVLCALGCSGSFTLGHVLYPPNLLEYENEQYVLHCRSLVRDVTVHQSHFWPRHVLFCKYWTTRGRGQAMKLPLQLQTPTSAAHGWVLSEMFLHCLTRE
jgi:hypothetical protein